MEFMKVTNSNKSFYYTWKDLDYLPYAWLDKKDLKNLPTPFFIISLRPDCPVGFVSDEEDQLTNLIKLPDSFDKLNLNNDFRKDLKRVEKKNENVKLVYNEKDALERSSKWFLEFFKEPKKDFKRRMEVWKEKCYTISAYLNEELIAVHIAMKDGDTIYYFGCWWNREYKSLSTPVFLLKKDIEKAIEDKIKFYDLGIGDEPYKKKWGVIEKPTKNYAIMTKELADYLDVKKYVEIKNKEK
ncbi:Acetyltransferase (GNAT) domain protein [uncultured archaeon]|nr:Acetyltransferase (GNAT) domain protein [uncultured archaeon]